MTFEINMPEFGPGYVQSNLSIAENLIKKTKSDVVLFPSLFLSGASAKDMFLSAAFIQENMLALMRLQESSKQSSALIGIGLPYKIKNKLFNAYVFLNKGGIFHISYKNNLTAAETRYFCKGKNLPFEYNGKTVFVSFEAEKTFRADYLICPLAEVETFEGYNRRINKIKKRSKDSAVIAFGRGFGESSEHIVYTSHCIAAKNGKIIKEQAPFSGDKFDFDNKKEYAVNLRNIAAKSKKYPFIPNHDDGYGFIESILVNALKKRVLATRSKKLLIGVSGGSDSALSLMIAFETIKQLKYPLDSLKCVIMPSDESSATSINSAKQLCADLKLDAVVIPISNAVKAHLSDIGHSGKKDTAYENAQARERTQILMDMANMKGGIMLGTSDMSESMLGFSTYGGDHMSSYNVIIGVPKTLVLAMLKYYSQKCSLPLLSAIAGRVISPELVAGQVTEDIVGKYDLIDYFIYNKFSIADADKVFKEYGKEYIEKTHAGLILRFKKSQFKRNCAPDGVKVFDISASNKDIILPSDM